MHDSFMPLGGLVQMFNIGIGEVIFGGVGVGLIGMLFYVILAMFVSGLMIGRKPEFLGKKLGSYEMIMAMISMLLPMIAMVIFSAIAISTKTGLASLNNPSAHGLSEILYAYTSGHGNNGSAFAGLNANTLFYNTTIGAAILIGPIRDRDSRYRGGRLDRTAEDRAGKRRILPHDGRHVHNHPGQRDIHHGRPDLLPGLFARPRAGPPVHDPDETFLREALS